MRRARPAEATRAALVRGRRAVIAQIIATLVLVLVRVPADLTSRRLVFGAAMGLLGVAAAVALAWGLRRADLPRAWHGVAGTLVVAAIGMGVGALRHPTSAEVVLTVLTVATLGVLTVLLWRAFALRRGHTTTHVDAVLIGACAADAVHQLLGVTGQPGHVHAAQVLGVGVATALAAAVLLSGRYLRISAARWLVATGLLLLPLGRIIGARPDTGGLHAGELAGTSLVIVATSLLVLALHLAAALGPRSSVARRSAPADIAWWAPTAIGTAVLGLHAVAGQGDDGADPIALAILVVVAVALVVRVILSVSGLQAVSRTLAADRARYLAEARTDSLTGLANRQHLLDRLRADLAAGRLAAGVRPGSGPAADDAPATVLFCDLDRLKVVNDALGHDVGDHLIQAVAERWRAVVPGHVLLARIGGDEFALCGRVGRAQAESLAAALHVALQDPVHLGDVRLTTSTSIGLARADEPGATPDSMLRDADAAMYRAKALGSGRTVTFDGRIRAEAMSRMQVEAVVADAVRSRSAPIHLQPIVSLDRGEVVALEALLRLRHPDGRPVSPVEAIDVAEETGLVVPLGEVVLDRACAQLRWLWDQGHAVPTVAVNASASQLVDRSFVVAVERTLRRHRLPPEALMLEVTESVLLDVSGPAATTLAELVGRGIGVSMDDFGTGYSSLSYLSRLPMHQLKLDGAFIEGAAQRLGAVVLDGVLRIAHAIGVPVVAEKVEHADQVVTLRRLGCDLAQGWFFCRPLPVEELAAWLSGSDSGTRAAATPA